MARRPPRPRVPPTIHYPQSTIHFPLNWLNLEIRTLRSAEYIGSDPSERATWLNVLAYCCEQENGGRLTAARAWKDRQWQQVCGVTLREVLRTTRLFTWDGDTLVVLFYPVDSEAEVRAKRKGGREGGLRSGEARGKEPLSVPPAGSSASSSASPMLRSSPSTEGKEKERNGKGKESTQSESLPGLLLVLSPPSPLAETRDSPTRATGRGKTAALPGPFARSEADHPHDELWGDLCRYLGPQEMHACGAMWESRRELAGEALRHALGESKDTPRHNRAAYLTERYYAHGGLRVARLGDLTKGAA